MLDSAKTLLPSLHCLFHIQLTPSPKRHNIEEEDYSKRTERVLVLCKLFNCALTMDLLLLTNVRSKHCKMV